jgi:hypothetical protein
MVLKNQQAAGKSWFSRGLFMSYFRAAYFAGDAGVGL